MNVLILTSTYPRWNQDTTPGFVADFAKGIAPFLDHVYVLAPHYKGAAQREKSNNLYVKRYRYFFPAAAQNIFYNGGAVTKISRTLSYALKVVCFMIALFFNTLFYTLRYNVTIINAHWLIPQGFVGVLVKFVTGRTLAVTVHGSDVLNLNSHYMKKIKRFTLRHADLVYVNSSTTQAACRSLYERDYILIPMGIDVAHFRSAKHSKQLAERHGLGNFTILFVGRLSEEKGVIYLLEALALLKASGRNCKTLIIGDGPLAKNLQSYIEVHDLTSDVTMVGWIENSKLASYYATADILVGPSLYEAQGIVFLEALASGLPVITTDEGGMADFIKDGRNGFMVPAKSARALYDSILTLYDDRDLLKKLKSQAAASVTDKYSWKSVTERYVESWRQYT